MLSCRTSRRFAAQLGIAGLLPLAVGLGAPVPQPSPPTYKYDLAAFGATASGKVGDVVKVTVGVTNNGPDTLRKWGDSYGAVYWKVTLPPGTETVTGVQSALESRGAPEADHCDAEGGRRGEGNLGVGPYRCWSGHVFEPGKSSKGNFYLKITKVIPNATGTVEVYRIPGWRPPDDDRKPDNDKASFVVNPDPTVSGKSAGLLATRLPEVIGGALILLLLTVAGWLYLRTRRRAVRAEEPGELGSAAGQHRHHNAAISDGRQT